MLLINLNSKKHALILVPIALALEKNHIHKYEDLGHRATRHS